MKLLLWSVRFCYFYMGFYGCDNVAWQMLRYKCIHYIETRIDLLMLITYLFYKSECGVSEHLCYGQFNASIDAYYGDVW